MADILVISGLDPTGEAGLVADLEVLTALKKSAAAIVTALTAQNRRSFGATNAVPVGILAQQLALLLEEERPRWVKIGLLGSPEQVGFLADVLAPWRGRIVLDPILRTSSGSDLPAASMTELLLTRLAPLCAVFTPNLPEARRLVGDHNCGLEVDALAVRLVEIAARPVLIKGGHRDGSPTDHYFDGVAHQQIVSVCGRLPERRGTGCRLSTALAVALDNGQEMIDAIASAKTYVEQYLGDSAQL